MPLNIPPKVNDDGEYIFSVSELNTAVADLLERHFGEVLVQGEITGLKKYSSGHMYFTLKDPQASIRCVLFRGKQFGLTFIPGDGDQVSLRANLSIYQERGDFQLIVNKMEHSGQGNLQEQFLLLKQKLAQAGLFDTALKRPLPAFPQHLGIITSPDGAALHDVLTVLKRRYPRLPVRIYASQVQGNAAPQQLIRAIQYANQEHCCDVLLLTRGGGSLEDLWAFNDEGLAQAIYDSRIPIVSAIGHEVDFTIADYVADKRAPTPSAAAEMISPNQADLLSHLTHLSKRLTKQIQQRLQYAQLFVQQQHTKLKHPSHRLQLKLQHLDTLGLQLQQLIHNRLKCTRNSLRQVISQIQFHSPQQRIVKLNERLICINFALSKHISQSLEQRQKHLATLAAKLDVISPLSTLQRGYSIAQNKTRHIISSIHQIKVNDKFDLQLTDGKLHCNVLSKHQAD